MPEHAVVNYVSQTGEHVTLGGLKSTLGSIEAELEAGAKEVKSKLYKTVLEILAQGIHDIIPDLEALPPEPDPLRDAIDLLNAEVERAQVLLAEEAERTRREQTIKEAFCIPGALLFRIIEVVSPKATPEGAKELYDQITAVFEDRGWKVYHWANHLPSIESREPLRQLSTLLEQYPVHYLKRHVLEVLSRVTAWLAWCGTPSNVGVCRMPQSPGP
jgi:hypothetical protein